MTLVVRRCFQCSAAFTKRLASRRQDRGSAGRPAPAERHSSRHQAEQHHVPHNGEAVLIDFGLSHHNQLPDLLQAEFRLPYGTAPYMAPERLLGVRDDPRSDLFSLGVLLYFFTTGERPFGRARPCAGCGGGCGAIRIRRANSVPTIRHGFRRSCCGA